MNERRYPKSHSKKIVLVEKPREGLRDVPMKCSENHATLYDALLGPYFLLWSVFDYSCHTSSIWDIKCWGEAIVLSTLSLNEYIHSWNRFSEVSLW